MRTFELTSEGAFAPAAGRGVPVLCGRPQPRTPDAAVAPFRGADAGADRVAPVRHHRLPPAPARRACPVAERDHRVGAALPVVDEQRRGPYRLWIHEHRFEEQGGQTLASDHVQYAVRKGASSTVCSSGPVRSRSHLPVSRRCVTADLPVVRSVRPSARGCGIDAGLRGRAWFKLPMLQTYSVPAA